MKLIHKAVIKGHILSIQKFTKHFRVNMNGVSFFKGSPGQCKDVFNETADAINGLCPNVNAIKSVAQNQLKEV